jgi:hypothetical protein
LWELGKWEISLCCRRAELVKLEAVVLLTAKALSNAGFADLLKEED